MIHVAEILPTVAMLYPHRPALVAGGRRFTYAELNARVEASAADLSGRGVGMGDRVALLLPNGVDFVVSFFAVLRAGGIVVPLNDQYQERELGYFVDRCGVTRLIAASAHGDLCRRVLAERPVPCELIVAEEWSPSREGDLGDPASASPPEQPVMYQFSSGSTGTPKCIGRRHANLLFELESFRTTLGVGPEDRFLGVAPFSHVNGLMRSMMAALYSGACLYPVPRFERETVARLVSEERLTVFIAVPFMFGMLARSRFEPAADFSSLRLCISASAPMPVQLNREFLERFGQPVRQLYGSTETGTISVNLESDVSFNLDSVGRPLAGVEVEVWDEAGRPVPAGETGEVVVRSPAAIRNYEGLEQGQESFREDWFLTGDLGRLDRAGNLYLVGRKKFFINKGGYKINPQEIEDLLASHPGVEEAAVVGVPTAFDDEKVKAVVVPRGPIDPAELVAFCRGKIADFKIPSVIELREELPKSPTGKVRKRLLV
jgi:long-chain acyl-CoA synthetase